MFGIGMPELVVILVIIMIIFGANKLPQIGSGLAKGIRNFKEGVDEKEERPPGKKLKRFQGNKVIQ